MAALTMVHGLTTGIFHTRKAKKPKNPATAPITNSVSAYELAIAAPLDVAVMLVDVDVVILGPNDMLGGVKVGAVKVNVDKVNVGGGGRVMVGSVILPVGSDEILTEEWACRRPCTPATNARMRAEANFMMIINEYDRDKLKYKWSSSSRLAATRSVGARCTSAKTRAV